MRVLALADDLTGALEAGAKFAQSGMRAVVLTEHSNHLDADVVVIDTESRHLAAHQAAAVVQRVSRPAPLIYKKTDSTLRGNIRAELDALARAYPDSRIAYVPAYPEAGRTVRLGVLYVDGIPLDQTAFARDALNPVHSARVRDAAGDAAVIFDGETTADIAAAAERILAAPVYRIVAGPAAIAEALAARMSGGATAPSWPVVRTCLVVNGSLHDASAAQVRRALEQRWLSEDGDWRLLVTEVPTRSSALDVAKQTARAVVDLITRTEPDALIVFGGDTAFAIIDALGRPPLFPVGEVISGVPVSRIGDGGMHLITKAGGFGDVDAIGRVRAELKR